MLEEDDQQDQQLKKDIDFHSAEVDLPEIAKMKKCW
jgi:hypothetical protein